MSKSQHCGYDFISIIVLNVHAENSNIVIPNLKITLLDSNNNVLTEGKNTVVFCQNHYPLTFSYYKSLQRNFAFAKDNYILLCHSSFPANNYYIEIKDIDGQKNGGQFITIPIKIYETDKYLLCGRYDEDKYIQSYGERLYQPIEVILPRKE